MDPVTMNRAWQAFAVANTEEELSALIAMGFSPDNAAPLPVLSDGPPVVGGDDGAAPSTVEEARAALGALGRSYDRRWGLAKLLEAMK